MLLIMLHTKSMYNPLSNFPYFSFNLIISIMGVHNFKVKRLYSHINLSNTFNTCKCFT